MQIETPAWIIATILSVMLFIFLVIGVIVLIKILQLVKETQKILESSQSIVEKADTIMDNVKQASAVGGVIKIVADTFAKSFTACKEKEEKGKK